MTSTGRLFQQTLKILASAVCLSINVAMAEPQPLNFADLSGWPDDDHAAALSVFRSTCADMPGEAWARLCLASTDALNARQFFETQFQPTLIEDGSAGLFTAYYEPELVGSRTQTERFSHPIYAVPDEAKGPGPWLERRGLLKSGVLQGRGLELAWLDDPVDLFFLQIQGSGRIRFQDGSTLRVGFGGRNGHPYRSIGRKLVADGQMTLAEASADSIKDWVRSNGARGLELLYHNPSYVFFREVSHISAELGPLGAMNRPITAMRSLAIDPGYTPLGAPVWIEKDGLAPLRRLMVAQDTGSAIKGAQRADIFFGTGQEAGQAASNVRDPGRMVVLLPKAMP